MTRRILHIGKCDKFIPPFIEFVNSNFNFEEHLFLLKAGMAEKELLPHENVKLIGKKRYSNITYYLNAIIKMHLSEKIILHSLFDINIVKILFFAPWLLKKCHWVIWGGDLYTYKFGKKTFKWKVKEFLRRHVIRNIGFLVTYLEGDVNLAREWYGAKGLHFECLMYTSNLFQCQRFEKKYNDGINILLGNSAASSNNHIATLEKLLDFKNQNITIYTPLSYGPQEHAQKVIKQGKEWFGDKFKPLTSFMPFEEYLQLLSNIDIALFNHKRQQAMGNTITLLGLGKTVYVDSSTTQWKFFEDKGIKVNDIDKFDSLELEKNNENIEIIRNYFSIKNYHKQLQKIFL